MLGVLTALGFILPIALYFWLISADAVDMFGRISGTTSA